VTKRGKLWIVRVGDGNTVAEVLRRAGEDLSAVDDGRVFVGRKRALSVDVEVSPGDAITIGGVSPGRPDIAILLQRDDLVACVKPAGIPTIPDLGGAAHALVARVAEMIGRDASELRVTSRLDRDVSGSVVFALSGEAEAALLRAREEGSYVRRYVAIAAGPLPDAGTWDVAIGRARDPRRRAANGPDAKSATTRFRVVARAGTFALVAVSPVTGRTHQIRIHASHAGAPLLGDRDYGGASRVTGSDGRVVALPRIALHCARVAVPPLDLDARAPVPPELAKVWAELGGEAEAWDTAVTCDVES
jgi:23S rRNA pseudouridine1911/1915/1917 synthase